jgi:hypothetical protein
VKLPKIKIKSSSPPIHSINWWEVDWGNRRVVDIAKQYGVTRQYASIQKQRCYSPILSITKKTIKEHKESVKKLKKMCGLTWRDLSSVLNITWKNLNNGTLTHDEYDRVIRLLEAYEKKG